MNQKTLITVLVIAAVAGGAWWWYNKQKQKQTATNTGSAPVGNNGGLIGQVGDSVDTITDAWNDLTGLFNRG